MVIRTVADGYKINERRDICDRNNDLEEITRDIEVLDIAQYGSNNNLEKIMNKIEDLNSDGVEKICDDVLQEHPAMFVFHSPRIAIAGGLITGVFMLLATKNLLRAELEAIQAEGGEFNIAPQQLIPLQELQRESNIQLEDVELNIFPQQNLIAFQELQRQLTELQRENSILRHRSDEQARQLQSFQQNSNRISGVNDIKDTTEEQKSSPGRSSSSPRVTGFEPSAHLIGNSISS